MARTISGRWTVEPLTCLKSIVHTLASAILLPPRNIASAISEKARRLKLRRGRRSRDERKEFPGADPGPAGFDFAEWHDNGDQPSTPFRPDLSGSSDSGVVVFMKTGSRREAEPD